MGEPAYHAFPASRWRRYHKLDRFPAGIVPFGDAVASFNPTFGQGMTMTSLRPVICGGRCNHASMTLPAN